MVKINSTSRLSSINSAVILTQTDTTVGFLSQDNLKLQKIKQRPLNKPFIQVYSSFKSLLESGIRIPKTRKLQMRRAKKTTFILKNISFRVAKTEQNSTLLQERKWNYSTSANESGKSFQREFCEENSDIIIENSDSLYEGVSSSLYKINHKKKVRLR
jgi:tRNA A37 threonylcarbamoyladenosine synthetase subunit TsaC/SUA5/YrdC